MNHQAQITIERRQEKERAALLETLKGAPVVNFACKKTGVSRSTFYRWYSEDGQFAHDVEKTLTEGRAFINDMAESQLIAQINAGKLPAIIWWQRHNDLRYKTSERKFFIPEQQPHHKNESEKNEQNIDEVEEKIRALIHERIKARYG